MSKDWTLGNAFAPSRRGVLKGMGLGALTASSIATGGCSDLLGDAPPIRTQVLVIGAGLSGLNAALLLEESGIDVQVVEASDRVGGRLHTRYDLEGRPEAGGYSVGSSYARVLYRCEQLDVGLRPQGKRSSGWSLNIGGENIAAEDWSNSPLNKTVGEERSVMPWALGSTVRGRLPQLADMEAWRSEAAHQYDVPFADMLREIGASDEAIRLMEWNANAPNYSELSAVASLRRAALSRALATPGGTFEVFNLAEGSSALPLAMAKALKTPVALSSPVREIDQSGEQVVVTTENGTFIADYVISSAPFTAMKDIKFTPDLPQPAAQFINETIYVPTSVVHIKPAERYWEEDGMSPAMWTDGAIGRVFKFWDDPEVRENDMLTVWVTGDACQPFDALSSKERADFVKSEMARLRPSSKGKIEVLGEDMWNQNPYSRGAYHMFKPGQVKAFGADLTKPVGNLYFAGEQCAVLMPGMEGAMEAGENAALTVLEKLNA